MGDLISRSVPLDCRQVIVVRKDLGMRKGKIAAQVAHATTKFLMDRCSWNESWSEAIPGRKTLAFMFSDAEAEWLTCGKATKIVVGVDGEEELIALMDKAREMNVSYQDIIDSGLTEFNGVPTRTCVGFGPALQKELDPLTGHLPLL